MRLLAPAINDVTTDLDDPPVFDGGKPGPFPARLGPVVRKHYPDLSPLVVSRPTADVFSAAAEVARSTPGWELSTVDPERGIIQGVAVTRLLRFKDDFVIRVRDAGSATRVDMRSKSRLGKGDLGANADRIDAYLTALRARL